MTLFLCVFEMQIKTFGMMISQHRIRMEFPEFGGDVPLPGLIGPRRPLMYLLPGCQLIVLGFLAIEFLSRNLPKLEFKVTHNRVQLSILLGILV